MMDSLTDPAFAPTRTAGLERLQRFVPRAGRAYAANRNYDRPGGGHADVSGLSPYLRHRLVTEEEVLRAVLGRHSAAAAEKFIQEVFWRSYWKGWLEMRPGVWSDYRQARSTARQAAERDAGLAARLTEAEAGRTGIACFDAWAEELVTTGYVHNHVRMWMASIWIFTLRLPWAWGADWFLRHLLDGDPASNTLGWRWVGGLQTRGKNYIARAENIARYTEGRFNPVGELNESAAPLEGDAPPPVTPLGPLTPVSSGRRTGLLLHEEDLSPRFIVNGLPGDIVAHASLNATAGRSDRDVSPGVIRFAEDAITDARARWADRLGTPGPRATMAEEIVDWAVGERVEQVATPYAPVGPAAAALAQVSAGLQAQGIALVPVRREWDSQAWPHATHGFFRFKNKIPKLLNDLCS